MNNQQLQKKLPIELKLYIINFIPYNYCNYCQKKTVYYYCKLNKYEPFYCSSLCSYKHNLIILFKLLIIVMYLFSLYLYFTVIVLVNMMFFSLLLGITYFCYYYWLLIILFIFFKTISINELPY